MIQRPATTSRKPATPFSVMAILNNLCPACHKAKITEGVLGMKKRCPNCDYDLHPENGYYLGAMMIGFVSISALTIPPVIILKVMNVDDTLLISYPLIQYLIVGPFILHYSKVIWAHLGYRAGYKMEEENQRNPGHRG